MRVCRAKSQHRCCVEFFLTVLFPELRSNTIQNPRSVTFAMGILSPPPNLLLSHISHLLSFLSPFSLSHISHLISYIYLSSHPFLYLISHIYLSSRPFLYLISHIYLSSHPFLYLISHTVCLSFLSPFLCLSFSSLTPFIFPLILFFVFCAHLTITLFLSLLSYTTYLSHTVYNILTLFLLSLYIIPSSPHTFFLNLSSLFSSLCQSFLYPFLSTFISSHLSSKSFTCS